MVQFLYNWRRNDYADAWAMAWILVVNQRRSEAMILSMVKRPRPTTPDWPDEPRAAFSRELRLGDRVVLALV